VETRKNFMQNLLMKETDECVAVDVFFKMDEIIASLSGEGFLKFSACFWKLN
jgi:hypothetical protein